MLELHTYTTGRSRARFWKGNIDLSYRGQRNTRGFPKPQGLYDSRNEHDACGIGFVANLKGVKSHKIVQQGLQILCNITHRGAVGADPKAGDGAGILVQIPDEYMRSECANLGFDLPVVGDYAVGAIFLPQDDVLRKACEEILEQFVKSEGQEFLGWRDVPVDNSDLGYSVKPTEPRIRQIFIQRGEGCEDTNTFERKLFVIRKQVEIEIDALGAEFADFYVASLSARTLLYKGMVLADQVGAFYLDLQDSRFKSALALVHQRFSTNTFPTWKLAQPFRSLAHNGEINTLKGNINWMKVHEQEMHSPLFQNIENLKPVIPSGNSDSASLDNVFELLTTSGHSAPLAKLMLIPDAWSKKSKVLPKEHLQLFNFLNSSMEPWDGPAAIAGTDNEWVIVASDRNGLRPMRYTVTNEKLLFAGSETGMIDIDEKKIIEKGRLGPGEILGIRIEKGKIFRNTEIKNYLAKEYKHFNNQIVDLDKKIACFPEDGVLLIAVRSSVPTRKHIIMESENGTISMDHFPNTV